MLDSPPLDIEERSQATDSVDQTSQSEIKLASNEDNVDTDVSPISESVQQPIVPTRPKPKAQQISPISDMTENADPENLTDSTPVIPTRPLKRNTTSTLENIISGYSDEIDSDIETNTRETINDSSDTALGTNNDVEQLSLSDISTCNDSNHSTRLSEDKENVLDSNGAKPIIPSRPSRPQRGNITDTKTLVEEPRGVLEDVGPISSQIESDQTIDGQTIDGTNGRDPVKLDSVDESEHQKNIEESNKIDIPNLDRSTSSEHSQKVKPIANDKETENLDENSKVVQSIEGSTEHSSDLNIDKSEYVEQKQKQELEPEVAFELQKENDIQPVCDNQGETLTPNIPERPTKATTDNTKRPNIPARPRKKTSSEASDMEVTNTNTKPKAPPPKPKKTSAKIAAFQQMFNAPESTLPQRRDSTDSTSSKTTSNKLSTDKIKFAENLRNVVGRGIALPGMADAGLMKSSNDTSEENQSLEASESKITNVRKARKPKGRLPKALKNPMVIEQESRFTVVLGQLWKYTHTKSVPNEEKDENVELDSTGNVSKLTGEEIDPVDKHLENPDDISTVITPREESSMHDESKVIHDEQNREVHDEVSSKEIADVADAAPRPEVCSTDSEEIVIHVLKNGCSSDPNETSHGEVVEHSAEQEQATNSDEVYSPVDNENDSTGQVQEKVDSIKQIDESDMISEHQALANDEFREPQTELPLRRARYESNEKNEQTLDEVPEPLIDEQE